MAEKNKRVTCRAMMNCKEYASGRMKASPCVGAHLKAIILIVQYKFSGVALSVNSQKVMVRC
jgi:hypothetical protein